ncbi:MAG TPA: FAD binding domain-containing protein [Drouetiella sp.]
MRDYILLYVNGREHRIRGEQAFVPITDYLRYDNGLCGTKVVCAEGDCGACTALVGHLEGDKIVYRAVNSCIQFLFQLDCSHVITVEGLKLDQQLNAVQQSMVDCHGAQCGYCTPGFVVALCGLYDKKKCPVDLATVKEELTGNLCRCTGYESIIKAAQEIDEARLFNADQMYPPQEMIVEFRKHLGESIEINAGERVFCNPVSVAEAVNFKAKHPGTVIVSGGTDVSVNANKRGINPPAIISTSNIPGLTEIVLNNNVIEVGARANLRDLELFVKDLVPEFYKVLWVFGSPQIRSAGTLAGNIANASPIGDTIPFLFVVNAEIEVTGVAGSRRIKMNELYTGYKTMTLKADEMITRTFIPVPEKTEVLKLYKISKREQLDISSFSAAINLAKKDSRIESVRIAYGGIAATVVRMPKTEDYLTGKEFTLDTFEQAGKIARSEIKPLSDVRGSSDFRLQLSENILLKFFHETADERELVCQ